jgi:hypothetical protein
MASNRVLLEQSQSLRTKSTSLLNSLEYAALLESSRLPRPHQNNSRLQNGHSFLNWAVDSAVQITNASQSNLQIIDPASRTLHIAAQRGFRQPFLDFFKCVHGPGSACGKAFDTRERVLVEDVTESSIFCGTPALEVLLDADVRAVQSTPLIGSSGVILGVISTHWRTRVRLNNRSFARLDALARTIARWLEHNL